MFEPAQVAAVICLYMGLLFLIAWRVERSAAAGRNRGNHPLVYALSLAVYCTAWTYYGSVGKAANTGMLFVTIYLGPTLSVLLWWKILPKLVRIKNTHRITNIADFISLRYDRSSSLAAMATLLVLVGITPYIALQLKAVISTFQILTAPGGREGALLAGPVGPLVAGLMVVFTILVGVRRIDPTERHQGMIMAVAVESVVKLLVFLVAGIFVTYFVFDGFGDIFDAFSRTDLHGYMTTGGRPESSYLTWMSYLVLAMSAVLFLPRQFHVAVVENFQEAHIRTAMWLFPAHLLLINIFVVPIAMGGLLTGYSPAEADTFVLRLPMEAGSRWLSLLVFLGGFSAATSMVMISGMTVATMITNHLLLPLVFAFRRLGFLRRYLLQCRWVALTAWIFIGYGFAETVGETRFLVNMGIMSFAAALQFAPCILGGLFWAQGSKTGAHLGLGAGFLLWGYTMLMPAFARNGWIPEALLTQGPLGLRLLAPEHLFGLTGLDPIANTVFWSLLLNTGCYVIGSYLFGGSEQEKRLAREFIGAPARPALTVRHGFAAPHPIDLAGKSRHLRKILRHYFPATQAAGMIEQCVHAAGLAGESQLDVLQLADLHGRVEKMLAGSIGAAAARQAMLREAVFSPGESEALSSAYAELLASIKVPPEELKEKIDYYRERESLLLEQAREMAVRFRELEAEIAERKKAEAALQESKEKYQGIFDQTFQLTGLLTPAGEVLEANQTALDMIRAVESDVKGKPLWETPWWRHAPEEQERLKRALGEAARGRLVRYETTNCAYDGSLVNVDVSLKPVKNQRGEVIYIIPEGRDITERKRAEEALRENEKWLQGILEANPDPVVVYDREGKTLFINPAFTRVFGWTFDELKGRRIPYIPPDRRQQVEESIREVVESGRNVRFETERFTKGGATLNVAVSAAAIQDESGSISSMVVNLRDITEIKKLQIHLQQSQKMEAIGTLAGGIAHDFNNILCGIMGHAELSEMDSPEDSPIRSHLQEILRASDRARGLVRQILTFSRQTNQELKPTRLKPILDEATRLLRATIPANIDIVQEIQSDAFVMGDPTQIHQILMNLCANAAHALREGGGRIEVSLRDREVEAGDAALGHGMAAGRYVALVVEDTGQGMAPEVMDRIFDPFFTTKEMGEGTGMGLSVVHGIVKSYGGKILVESAPGKGARFTILLPRILDPEPQAVEEETDIRGGTERILFVDDEESIASINKEILERLGYRVTIRTSSLEALALFERDAFGFDLVITDLTMPDMTGDELASRMTSIRADIPVILCTGYGPGVDEERLRRQGIRALLMKPIVSRQMARSIREVLEG